MIFTKQIINLKSGFLTGLSFLIDKIATIIFSHPKNPGMPKFPTDTLQRSLLSYQSSLPIFRTRIPPIPAPKSFLQAIFGNVPKTTPIKKVFYEHKREGFYNFYVKNYKNILFLPDWLSQWVQLNWNLSIDTTSLEIIREAIFFGLLGFSILLQFRLKLYWFLTINPYTRPWIYIISLTDWIYDIMTGFAPISFGIDLSPMIILGLLGRLLDMLNILVFTIPFLPSEGTPEKLIIDNELTDVLLFRYLPSLWYSHGIPNKLRNFWYYQRPEIYKFMKENYGQLNIKLLPNKLFRG